MLESQWCKMNWVSWELQSSWLIDTFSVQTWGWGRKRMGIPFIYTQIDHKVHNHSTIKKEKENNSLKFSYNWLRISPPPFDSLFRKIRISFNLESTAEVHASISGIIFDIGSTNSLVSSWISQFREIRKDTICCTRTIAISYIDLRIYAWSPLAQERGMLCNS